MPDIPYGLTKDDFERVARAVRRAEGLPPRRDVQHRAPARGQGAPHNWIKVISAGPQTITLQKDALGQSKTIQGFAATWSFFDSSANGFVDHDPVQDPSTLVWFVGANGETPEPGIRISCHAVGQDVNGTVIWSQTLGAGIVRVTAADLSMVYLGRSVTDAVLIAGSYVLQSATANFTLADVGATLIFGPPPSSPGDPPVTITGINTNVSPPTATMSAASPSNQTNVTVAIVINTVQCYQGVTAGWQSLPVAGIYDTTYQVWYYDINQLAVPSLFNGYRYFCDVLAYDAYGAPIYGGGRFFGASATDGIGNIFAYGTCINVGGVPPGGTTLGTGGGTSPVYPGPNIGTIDGGTWD